MRRKRGPHLKFPAGHKVQPPTPEDVRKERNARRKARRDAWARLVEIYKTGRVTLSARQARKQRKAQKRKEA